MKKQSTGGHNNADTLINNCRIVEDSVFRASRSSILTTLEPSDASTIWEWTCAGQERPLLLREDVLVGFGLTSDISTSFRS